MDEQSAVDRRDQLTAFEATTLPNKGHSFHKHTRQEELLYVVAGSVEQWIDREKRILAAGDSVFIPGDVVHASFNASQSDAKVVVIFSPCVGDIGFEAVELGGEAPWNALRH